MSDRLENIRIVNLEQTGGAEGSILRKVLGDTVADGARGFVEAVAGKPAADALSSATRRFGEATGLLSTVDEAEAEAAAATAGAADHDVPEDEAAPAPSAPPAEPAPSAPAAAPKPKKISKLQAIANKLKEVGYMAVYEHEFIKLLPFHDYEICNSTQVFGGCWKRSSRNRYTDIVRVFEEKDINKMFTHFGFYQMGNVWVKASNNAIPYVLKF